MPSPSETRDASITSADDAPAPRASLAPHLLCAGLVALLAAGNYVAWIHNYFVGDSWWLIGSMAEPDWSLRDLLPFRLPAHRINSTNYYAPVNTAVLWLAFKLGGFSPERYHLLSIAFHVGASLSLFAAALQLTHSGLKATLAGAIFATHFAITEAVGWFGAFSHPVAGFLGALSMALYARYLATKGGLWLAGACAALLLASLTQVTALPWFGILFCLDVFVSARGKRLKEAAPRLATITGMAVLVLLLQVPVVTIWGSGGYNYQIGPWVVRNLFYYPVSTFVPSLEVPSYVFATDLLLAPVRYDAFVQLMGMTEAFSMLLACGAVLVAVALLWTRGGWLSRFSIVAFGLGTVPFLLLNGHGYRYLYLPLMFFSVAMSSAVVDLFHHLRLRSSVAAAAVLATIPIFVALSFAESQRQLFWWQQAGFVTHKSLVQLREIQPELPRGALVVFVGLPDTLQRTNAQVWRNGIREAVRVIYNDRTLRVETYPDGEEVLRRLQRESRPAERTYTFVWRDWQFHEMRP